MFRSGNSRVSPTLVMATGLGMSTFFQLTMFEHGKFSVAQGVLQALYSIRMKCMIVRVFRRQQC